MSKELLMNKYFIKIITCVFAVVIIITYSVIYVALSSDIHRVTKDWLIDNLYQVETFSKVEGTDYYDVTLLNIEPALEKDFESLKDIFNTTPYTLTNSYYLKDGVNCQGMTYYIVDWCKRNNISFSIKYTKNHVSVIVNYEKERYEFSFSSSRYIKLLDEE